MKGSILLYILLTCSIVVNGSDETCVVLENGEQQCGDSDTTIKRQDAIKSVSTQNAPSCSIYIAESTIPGAGLGIFSGVQRKAKEIVWTGDVVNPVVDRKYHQMVLGPDTYKSDDVSLNPIENYEWIGGAMGVQHETAHPYVRPRFINAFAPGFTAALNSHQALYNTDQSMPKYDTNGLHRSKDPGAGAFTPYHGGDHFTLEALPAGSEIFSYYGDGYFKRRTNIYGLLPLAVHHDYAEVYAKQYYSLIKPLMYLGIWNFVVDNFPFQRRLMNALPKTMQDLETVKHGSIRDLYRPTAKVSLQKLSEEGRCVDTLEARPSTIPQAGRGAFSTRFFPKGSVVTGTPVIFVPTDDFFKMYEGDWETKKEVPNKDNVVHHQITYNYCFHHPESSVFLCPYGVGINYINHGRNNATANVKLQWARDGELGHNATILQQSPRNLLGNAAPRIFLNYVAARDIQEGDEILLDYGDSWQAAWDQHVRDFDEHKKEYPGDYQSARDWTKENMDAMLRTEDEQIDDPYPSHFACKCIVNDNLGRDAILKLWDREHAPAMPCRIMKRRKTFNGQYEYTVKYKNIGVRGPKISKQYIEDIEAMKWTESEWLHQVAVRFMDRPYTTDLWLPHAFRHPIGLPDDIFPEAWKNVHLSFADFASSSNAIN